MNPPNRANVPSEPPAWAAHVSAPRAAPRPALWPRLGTRVLTAPRAQRSPGQRSQPPAGTMLTPRG